MAEHFPPGELVESIAVKGWFSRTLRVVWSVEFASRLLDHCQRRGVQIVHNHGLWSQPNYVAFRVTCRLNLPLIASTHGMLAPWAWRHRAWRKRPVWWLWQRRALEAASVLRATSKQEVLDLRRHGLRNPIALIPNGVKLPAVNRLHGNADRIRTALFLSRIHPVKGLLTLVRAWAKVRPTGWQMVVCGPDENGHLGEVRRAVESAGLADEFDFRAPVYGEEKDALFRDADLFILPTFTENFGVAIAEAMAASLPVITTKGAPWECLNTHRCGWWIDIGVDPLAVALREACALSDEQRSAMGLRGRGYVAEHFSWDNIGVQMKQVYEWVLGLGPKPDCIIS